jgi:N6-adenosine-specific RNA methylase IME4
VIPFHPLADIFSLIEGYDLDELVKDVRERGLRERIELLEGRILDGRNRYRACVAAGLIPAELTAPNAVHLRFFHSFVPAGADSPSQDDLVAYVVSKNLRRRQLNDDQRRMVAARLVNLRQGRPADGKTSQIANISRGVAAKMLTSDVSGIDRARSIISHAVPEVIAAVEQGRVSVAAGAELAAQPVERQAEIVKALPRDEYGKLTAAAKKALAPVIKEIRAERQIEKKERRDAREAELGAKILAMPDVKAGLIISDFEYHFQVYSEKTGMDRHANNHYVTAREASTPEEIVERQRKRMSIAAPNCIHLMWCPASFNAVALKVMELQGFKYVSQLVWIKPGMGTGYWVRDCHELLLIGVRGKIPCPSMGEQFKSAIEAPKGKHSEKPDFQYEFAERFFPNLPKIELNARRSRPGWIAWGNEAPLPTRDPDVGPAIKPSQFANEAIVRPVQVASVVDDEIIDLPNILRRGTGNVAPWMTSGAVVPTP